jgi:hypothetical protein
MLALLGASQQSRAINLASGTTAINQALSGTLTSGSASLTPGPGQRPPTNTELAQAVGLAISSTTATLSDSIVGAATSYNSDIAPMIVGAAVTEELNLTGNDATDFATANSTTAKIVTASYTYAKLSTRLDPTSAASAIMAEVMTGIHANQGTLGSNYTSAVQNAVLYSVLSVRSITGGAAAQVLVPKAGQAGYSHLGGLLDNKAGVGNRKNDGKAPSTAPAAIVTSAVSQVQGVGQYTSNALVYAVVQTAVLGARNLYLEIAQAATTAAAIVSGNAAAFDAQNGDSLIIAAVLQGLPAAQRAAKRIYVVEAVKWGIRQAKIALAYGPATAGGIKYDGAGAKGIAYYAYNNCTGTPVTDINGL